MVDTAAQKLAPRKKAVPARYDPSRVTVHTEGVPSLEASTKTNIGDKQTLSENGGENP
jgi:hypothetical protein